MVGRKWLILNLTKFQCLKSGAIIPKYPVQQYVGELEFDELTLDLYYKEGKEKSVVYEDAQDGYDYKKR
jgi:alpha-glucosidase